MNSYDAEMHILRQKEASRRAAERYTTVSHLDEIRTTPRMRLAYQRAMVEVGSWLIAIGYRLQGSIDQLAPPMELTDTLSLVSKNRCVEC
jgi:hypothetical protein